MNTRIEAGPLTLQASAELVSPVTHVEINSDSSHVKELLQWTCFSPLVISINGHSLNAINPDFAKAGELTTLAMA
jgi:hypothetical protein